MRSKLIILAALAVIALLATACGGDDDGDSEATEEAAGAADDAAADDTAEEPADATAEEPADATAEEPAVETGALDATACTDIQTQFTDIGSTLVAGASGSLDTAAVQDAADTFHNAAGSVPAEVADDFNYLGDVFAEIATTFAGGTADPAAAQELAATVAAPEYNAAVLAVTAFFANGCQ